MARILAFAFHTPGHVFPFMPVLQELRARHHQVVAAILGGSAGTLGSIDVDPVEWQPQLLPARYPLTVGADSTPAGRAFALYGEPMADALDGAIARFGPDVLLIDPMLWGAMLAAEAAGFPWATVAHNPLTFRGRGTDVRGPGLPPGTGPWSRFRIAVAQERISVATASKLALVNRVRAARALAPLGRLSDMFLRPTSILATTAEPFEYPRTDWPEQLRFVGPMNWEPDGGNVDLPPAGNAPLVMVVGSSVPERPEYQDWTNRVITALGTEPYQVVATVPTGPLPANTPANATVARLLPHSRLLDRAACVVCHGGPGITHKALAFGVPVVAIPFAFDRFEVARRVEHAHAGVRLPIDRCSPSGIRRAVARAIRMRAGARRIAASFASAGGAARAADAVEALYKL